MFAGASGGNRCDNNPPPTRSAPPWMHRCWTNSNRNTEQSRGYSPGSTRPRRPPNSNRSPRDSAGVNLVLRRGRTRWRADSNLSLDVSPRLSIALRGGLMHRGILRRGRGVRLLSDRRRESRGNCRTASRNSRWLMERPRGREHPCVETAQATSNPTGQAASNPNGHRRRILRDHVRPQTGMLT